MKRVVERAGPSALPARASLPDGLVEGTVCAHSGQVPTPLCQVRRRVRLPAARKYIAGHLPNSAANLARWIRDPRQINPHTAMPAMDVTESDARDMAAYLLSK